ncbi:hypothetical protein [Thioalkalivibrio sp. ALJ3]|uniref:hypothetical protein n=1 Tax=Thioalkalivibrio sp. ALJ3 TaxID=1240557 RepID=UPI00036D63CA|nr:hypothetical protein [Thioalkalivibrio sp. ALJ3]
MTIGVAWVRTTHRKAQELMLVSDSRLNAGGFLDAGPKVFTLPRTDAAIAFAGDTYFAYPLIAQVSQSIASHFPLKDRAIDYVPFRTHVIKLLNSIFAYYRTELKELRVPDTEFLLAGYSWFKKEFCIDRIYYVSGKTRFEHRECKTRFGGFGKCMFIGDWAKKGERQLWSILSDRFGLESVSSDEPSENQFDYEPFEVVRDLLRNAGPNDTIAGAPQIVSVSQHMNSRHTAVYWPDKSCEKVFLGGRPVFGFENIENWIMDPDSFESSHLSFGQRREGEDSCA